MVAQPTSGEGSRAQVTPNMLLFIGHSCNDKL